MTYPPGDLLDATALVQGLQDARLLPVDVMNAHLTRIREWDPKLRAVAHSLARAAREASRAMLAGGKRRLLEHLPVSFKGNLVVGGAPTLWGTAWSHRGDVAPAEDGELARRCCAA